MDSNNFVLEKTTAKRHLELRDVMANLPFDQWMDINTGLMHLISYAVPRLIDAPPIDKDAVPAIQCLLDFQGDLNGFIIGNLKEEEVESC